MPIVWRDRLNTGNDKIDTDHRYLFCLFNSIELATSHPDLMKHLPVFFAQLQAYTAEHFSREEKIQLRIGYPDAVEHRRLHAEILRQLEGVQAKVNRLMAEATPDDERAALREDLVGEALNLAREWVINHVVKVDCTMIPYLAKHPSDLH